MKKRHCLKIFALTLSTIILCSCVPHTELNEKAIVMAMGIDYENDLYSVSFQYYSPTGLGGRTMVDNSQPNVLTSSGKGETVYGALEEASLRCGKELMLGVTQIIIIGEEAAKHSVEKVISITKTYFQSHPDMMVTVAEGKAGDMMRVKFNEGIVSTQKLKFMLLNAEKSGIAEQPTALGLFIALQTKQKSACLPRLRLIDSGKSDASQDGRALEIAGGVLIKDGKMIEKTDMETMSGLRILLKNTKTATITAEYENEKIAVELVDVNTKIRPYEEDGRPAISIDISSQGRYLTALKNAPITGNRDIESLCAEQLIKRIENALKNTVLKHGADVFLIERRIRHYNYGLWKAIEENFEEYLKSCKFKINVAIDIDKLILTK